MRILRTDVVSHSQLEGSGSVELDGVGDYLTFGSHSAFSPATADITIEFWFYLTDGTNLSSGNYYFCDMGSNGYRFQIYNGGLYWAVDPNDYVGPINNVLSNNTWHHIAGVRDGNALELYLDGVHLGTKITTASVTSTTFTIGSYSTGGGDYEPYGYISNFRYVRGVVYKGPFTPPKFELKNIPGTIVLGCQSTTSATDFAVTPSTVTANGDAAASAFHPGLKKDITDAGVVFDGVTTFDSQAYMVPSSGKTTERNRGRGIFGDADQSNDIEFIEIQSMGNSQEFGDSTTIYKQRSSVSSSIRAVTAGGFDSPAFTNIIDFITIANTANATDFGDLLTAKRNIGGAGNNTRGIYLGGANPGSTNTIEFITIATAGNAQDFGDATAAKSGLGALASPTRACFGGGQDNTIEFVTIATTGNASDFGDLISGTTEKPAGTSSSTRGLFICGESQPSGTRINTIQFITIASTGNATDFGDHTDSRRSFGACNNSTRAVYGGGNTSSGSDNALSFVTIATTGNGQDFGDLLSARSTAGTASSDSHGGIE